MSVTDDLPRIEPSRLTDLVEEMEHAVGQGRWNEASRFFTPDATYRVGSKPVFAGIAGIRSYMEGQNRLVRWEGHDLRSKFSRGPVAYFEVISHFTRLRDDREIHVPCTDIYSFSADRICDWRVYSDMSLFE